MEHTGVASARDNSGPNPCCIPGAMTEMTPPLEREDAGVVAPTPLFNTLPGLCRPWRMPADLLNEGSRNTGI